MSPSSYVKHREAPPNAKSWMGQSRSESGGTINRAARDPGYSSVTTGHAKWLLEDSQVKQSGDL